MNKNIVNNTVGIVGAGPVGLTVAARLANYGIRSIILEQSPHLIRKGSKACLIQGDALEVLDKSGCADVIAEEGIHWRIAHTYVRGKELISQEYPERVGYGEFVNISQYRIEQEVAGYIEKNPLTEIFWSYEVEAVSQDSQTVTIIANTPEGKRELSFAYLVACDGVYSKIRDLTGVAWTGYTHQSRFLITDIRANIPLKKERHFHFDPEFNPGLQLVMHPQPDNIWRIDWQLAADADIEAERENGELDRRIRRVIGDIPYNIEWLSTYKFNQRVVEKFRINRIFFAGDSAHSLPPYGSRGMNSGIQDADNLAWKMAYVLKGWADDSLLDTYHDERYLAAKENLRVTEATIKFMAPSSGLRHLIRNIILKLSSHFKSFRSLVDHGKMAQPFSYTTSEIIDSEPNEAYEFARKADKSSLDIPLKVVLAFPKGVEHDSMPENATNVYYDDIKFIRDFYHERAAWYVVRPDGHIAGRYQLCDVEAINHIIGRCIGSNSAEVESTTDLDCYDKAS
ncbi:MAG: FAD-dependent monooxygenase [Exilibacterium sp.]